MKNLFDRKTAIGGLLLYIGYLCGINGGILGVGIEMVGLFSVVYLVYTFIAGKFRKKS